MVVEGDLFTKQFAILIASSQNLLRQTYIKDCTLSSLKECLVHSFNFYLFPKACWNLLSRDFSQNFTPSNNNMELCMFFFSFLASAIRLSYISISIIYFVSPFNTASHSLCVRKSIFTRHKLMLLFRRFSTLNLLMSELLYNLV